MEILVSNPSFSAKKEEIKQYFADKNIEYVDNGNFDVLIDALCYISMTLGTHISTLYSNLYLDSSIDYKTILTRAKEIGYLPHRQIDSKTDVKLTYTGALETNSFNIDEIVFYGKSKKLQYIAEDIVMNPNDNNEYIIEFVATQRVYKSFEYSGDSTIHQTIILPDQNISNSDFIITSKIGNKTYSWNEINEYDKLASFDDRIYHVKYENSYIKLVFGNGVIGRTPTLDEKLTIGYYTNSGINANDETKWSIQNIKAQGGVASNELSNYTFENSTSYGGTGYESKEEIKINAPKHFSRFGYSIVKYDFDRLNSVEDENILDSTIMTNSYSTNSSVLGSHDFYAVPIDFYTAVDDNNNSFVSGNITNLNISSVTADVYKNYISNAEINVVSPTYLVLNVNSIVNVTTKVNKNQLSNDIWSDLKSIANDELKGFNVNYKVDSFYNNVQSGISSLNINTSLTWIFDKMSLLSTKYVKLPANTLHTNESYILDLKVNDLYSNVTNEDTIKSIYCDLGTNDFSRILIGEESGGSIVDNEVCSLTFDNDELVNSFVSGTTSYNGSNIVFVTDVKIDNYILQLKVVEKTSTVVNLFSTPLTNTFASEYNLLDDTKYLLYVISGDEQYLVGEIVYTDNPIRVWGFKHATNDAYLNNLFNSMNIVSIASNIFVFDFTVSNELDILKTIMTINMQYNEISTTSKYKLKLNSKKRILDFNYDGNIIVNNVDSIFTVDIDGTTLTLKSLSNDVICTVRVDGNGSEILSINAYPSQNEYSNLKNYKIKITDNNGNYTLCMYENIDNSVIADIDIVTGLIQFHDNVSYETDIKYHTISGDTIENILDKILDDNIILGDIKIKNVNSINFDNSVYLNTNVVKPIIKEV